MAFKLRRNLPLNLPHTFAPSGAQWFIYFVYAAFAPQLSPSLSIFNALDNRCFSSGVMQLLVHTGCIIEMPLVSKMQMTKTHNQQRNIVGMWESISITRTVMQKI